MLRGVLLALFMRTRDGHWKDTGKEYVESIEFEPVCMYRGTGMDGDAVRRSAERRRGAARGQAV